MFSTKEKKERALGVKLFLKPERCVGVKCAAVRKPYRPGPHGKSRRGAPSEMKLQLFEKQRIKATYGIREAAMRRIVSEATRHPGVTGELIVSNLERRLDNVVFRLGFAPSRSVARQLVSHGHFLVNGKKVTIPSYLVRINEVVSTRPQSKNHPVFTDLPLTLKKSPAPVWLERDDEKIEGKLVSLPKDVTFPFDVNLVVDYFAK